MNSMFVTLRPSRWVLCVFASWLGAGASSVPATISASNVAFASTSASAYACGGTVEARTWQLWDSQGRDFLNAQLIQSRLLSQGDTYALYDIQIIFNNLQAMARRCARTSRLIQLADDLMLIFDALKPFPRGAAHEFAWICSGGQVCNERNRLVNTEVMLFSAQGLGLLSALARDLAYSHSSQAKTHPMIARTAQVSVQHLSRWGGLRQRQKWQMLAEANAADVKDGSSALFFTDFPMWQLTIYAHLAGIAAMQPQWFADVKPGTVNHLNLASNLAALLYFFERRVTLATAHSLQFGEVQVADLDRGFWRLYPDHRFASYSGKEPPTVCQTEPSNAQSLHIQVKQLFRADDVPPPVPNLGWDISHARRLVQFFDAFYANSHPVQAWWGVASNTIPSEPLAQAFAAQLLAKVWNGDLHAPLFANYWNGTNGWYRVAYDDKTDRCNAGYPPFGLSDAFVTGGYAQWTIYNKLIGQLARRIYERSQSTETEDVVFIQSFYPHLSAKASPNKKLIQEIMFWPSLVH